MKALKASKPSDLLQALRDSAEAKKGRATKPKSANSNSARQKPTKADKAGSSTSSSRRKAG